MNNNNAISINLGGGLLQVAFVVLKLCGVINWSWWLVLLPTWVSIFILAAVLLIIVLRAKS